MIDINNPPTLGDIVAKYSVILIDTSALCNCLGNKQNLTSIEEKSIACEESYKCTSVLRDYLNKGFPCFTTFPVLEEFQARDHYNYKKVIKKSGHQQNRKFLDFSRKIRDAQKEQRKLIITFQEKDRILKLKENEQILYNTFDKNYTMLKEQYNLSDVDFDLLISGAVISQTRESSVLVSNDMRGIFPAWRYILRKGKITFKRFGFVSRRGINSFF